jgi:uncharacterized protein (DUF2132 family)
MIVFVDNQFCWGQDPSWNSSEPKLRFFNWARDFLDAHYELMAEVPIDNSQWPEWADPGRYYIFRRNQQ